MNARTGPDRSRGTADADAPMDSGPDAALIRLRAVTKTYGQGSAAFQALRGLDLDIHRGEFVALMGPSGSGKSTVMNILGCLDSPDGGSYRFGDIEVTHMNRDQRALLRRYYLGFVFQGFNLLARTAAMENVELPLRYRRVARRERQQRAREALALVGLDGKERNTPAELSGGQQQRVAIARAIVTEPKVLFADEPTGNLDTHRSHEIMELLCRLNRERQLTVLMVTHEPDMAAYAHRIVHCVDGRIDREEIRSGTPGTVAADRPLPEDGR